jgi:membrane protease YdiL (CAAX protease family)
MIVLWVTLLVVWIVYREGQAISVQYRYAEIGRGAGIGLVVGLPLMVFVRGWLGDAVPKLYLGVIQPPEAGVMSIALFTSLVLLGPLAECLFFRDTVQRERGLWVAILLYAATAVIFFLPTASENAMVLIGITGATAALGIVYAFLYERYGLTTALVCHAMVNLFLLFVPTVLSQSGIFAQ